MTGTGATDGLAVLDGGVDAAEALARGDWIEAGVDGLRAGLFGDRNAPRKDWRADADRILSVRASPFPPTRESTITDNPLDSRFRGDEDD